MTTRLWGPTRLVNENTDQDQISPQVAVMPDGLILVVWDDLEQGAVMLRLYLPDGTPFSPEIPLADALPGAGRPAITAAPCGCDVLIAYQGENDEVIVLAVDPFSGVFFYDSAVGRSAALAADIDGKALIATTAPSGDLVVQLNDSVGDVVNTTIVATADRSPGAVDITYLQDGSAVVVWLEAASFNNQNARLAADPLGSIRYQVIDPEGNLAGDSETVSGEANIGGKVAALADGGFVIVFPQDFEEGFGNEITGVIVGPDGAVTYLNQINGSKAGEQLFADVIGLRDGGFFAVWWTETGGGAIKGQAYDSSGVRVGQEVRVGAAPGDLQDERGLNVDLTPDGRVVVTWESGGTDGDGYGVRMQIVDPRDGYVEGTDDADLLYGSAFEDQVLALDGDDLVFAGSSSDDVRGAEGDDEVYGDAGDDEIHGEEGDDYLYGGAGADLIEGGVGFDYISGGASDDVIDGGDDPDNLFAGSGADTLLGGEGFDNLHGEAGEDALFGGEESDFLEGGAGADLVDGGAGDSDYVSFEDKTLGVTLTLTGGDPATAFVGGVAEDTVIDVENINGGAGNDVFTGGGERNQLNGEDGEDVLDGGEGPDELVGGAGNDVLRASAGDELDGDDGVDTADFSSVTVGVYATLNDGSNVQIGADMAEIQEIENLTGGSAGDRLTGDASENALLGGGANDQLKGGAGNDLLDGGAGTGDTADYRDKTQAVSVTLTGNSPTLVSVGGVAEDTMRGVEFIFGGSAADELNGDGNANLFRGGAGADMIYGGGGADMVDFRDKTAAVVLTLDGLNAATATVGGVAEDVVRSIEGIYGGTRGDTLTGDQYANRLYGGAGADVLRGGRGADVLGGGLGADTFVYAAPLDSLPIAARFDTIVDFSSNEGDRIDLSFIDANTAQTGDQLFVFGAMAAGSAGMLQLTQVSAFRYRVDGDVNGDGAADFSLIVDAPLSSVQEDSFVL